MLLLEQFGIQGVINLACIFWLLFTSFAEQSIISLTFAAYMKSLGDTDLQIYTISLPMMYISAAMTMLYIATRKDPNIRIIAIVTALSALVGIVIYIFPWSPWSIVLARFLCGMSYGDSIMKLIYIHKYIPLQYQKTTMTYMFLDTLFGFAFGFAANACTEAYFPEEGVINKLNGGILMLCPFLLIQVISFTFFYVKPTVQYEYSVSQQGTDRNYSRISCGFIILLSSYFPIFGHACGDQIIVQIFDYFGYPYFIIWYWQLAVFAVACLGIYFNPQSRSLTTTMICIAVFATTFANIIFFFIYKSIFVYHTGIFISILFASSAEINLDVKFLEIIDEVSNPNLYIMTKEMIKTTVLGLALLITGEMYDNKEGLRMFWGIFFLQTCPAIVAAGILSYNENKLKIVDNEKEMDI